MWRAASPAWIQNNLFLKFSFFLRKLCNNVIITSISNSGQQTNGGKCGLCGDPVTDPEPRAHEDGGKWGKGIIVAQYFSGQVVNTRILITAHHKGTDIEKNHF